MGKRIKIIMNQDVLNVGEEGDICEVAPGYARNFLFPRKMAVPYTKHSLTILSQRKRTIDKRKEEKRITAQGLKEQIQQQEIVFIMPAGENGKLFGSITNSHISEELQKKGFTIEKKKIEVPDHHLKMLGNYTVKIKLYGNEEAALKVNIKAIEPSPEEKALKEQKAARGERTRKSRKAVNVTTAPEQTDSDDNRSTEQEKPGVQE